MRKPSKPREPNKPNRKTFSAVNTASIQVPQDCTVRMLLDALPEAVELDNVRVTRAYEVGWRGGFKLYIEYDLVAEQQEVEYQKACTKYETDFVKYKERMVPYEKKLAEWKVWKLAKVQKEIKES